MNDIMKLVPNGRRQSTSQTQMNSKVIERLYILKKELQQRKSGERRKLWLSISGSTYMTHIGFESQYTNSGVQGQNLHFYKTQFLLAVPFLEEDRNLISVSWNLFHTAASFFSRPV